MKILIVSALFPPMNVSGAVRVGNEAKYLARLGHEVRVLAARPHPQRDAATPFSKARRQVWNGVHVEYARNLDVVASAKQVRSHWRQLRRSTTQTTTTSPKAGNERPGRLHTVSRWVEVPDAYGGWIVPAILRGRRIIRQWRPDLIYQSSLPRSTLTVGMHLARRIDTPLVTEFRDPPLLDQPNLRLPVLQRHLGQQLELHAEQQSSAFVTVSAPLAEPIRLRTRKPVVVVSHGFDADHAATKPPPPPDWSPACLHVVYTGLVYGPRIAAVASLFDVLADMDRATRRRLRIHFYGRDLQAVSACAAAAGVSASVVVHPPCSHAESTQLQVAADVLLMLLWGAQENKGFFSGKLGEYLGAGRPILAVGPPGQVAGEVIRARRLGLASDDSTAIAHQLQIWMQQKQQGAVPGIERAQVQDFSYAAQVRKLAELFDETRQNKKKKRAG